jgi:hypothetical protein
MRYLLSYRKFEALQISPTDDPEDNAAKEEINEIEKHLKEFSAIKAEIDQIFASSENNEEINSKIEEITDKNKGNPLIDEYIRVTGLQKKVLNSQQEFAKYSDDLFSASEELKELSKSKADSASILAKTKTIAEIKKAQAAKKTELENLKKEVLKAEKDMKQQMADMKKDSEDNMSVIEK